MNQAEAVHLQTPDRQSETKTATPVRQSGSHSQVVLQEQSVLLNETILPDLQDLTALHQEAVPPDQETSAAQAVAARQAVLVRHPEAVPHPVEDADKQYQTTIKTKAKPASIFSICQICRFCLSHKPQIHIDK